MAAEEVLNPACPFAGQKRADGVDQPPARADQLGRDAE
jgi:hypothetical protein